MGGAEFFYEFAVSVAQFEFDDAGFGVGDDDAYGLPGAWFVIYAGDADFDAESAP